MAKGKQRVQADGGGVRKGAPDGVSETSKRGSSGESQGGAYPNPHRGKKPKDGFMSHGGQTENNYHGTGQLGGQDVDEQENANSPAKNE